MVRCRRLLEIRLMAGNARRGHGFKIAIGRVLMAGIAIDCRVSASKREAIVMLLNFLDRHSPSPHGVALFAICAQLALMYVGVAVLAALAHVAEHRLHMALRARYILMQAAQRIMGLIVIEFRDGADRLPAVRCVTVLTRDVQFAMRTMATTGNLVRSTRK